MSLISVAIVGYTSLLVSCCAQTSKIGALTEVEGSKDPEGLKSFYFLVQDLKAFVFSLVNLHYKVHFSLVLYFAGSCFPFSTTTRL